MAGSGARRRRARAAVAAAPRPAGRVRAGRLDDALRDYDELLDYCRRSADPIGRLLLALYRRTDAPAIAWSDAICTGLQLTNFWQDVALDWDKGRVYLPREDLLRFGVNEAQIAGAAARRALDRPDELRSRPRPTVAELRRPADPRTARTRRVSNCDWSCRADCASSSASKRLPATCSTAGRYWPRATGC